MYDTIRSIEPVHTHMCILATHTSRIRAVLFSSKYNSYRIRVCMSGFIFVHFSLFFPSTRRGLKFVSMIRLHLVRNSAAADEQLGNLTTI